MNKDQLQTALETVLAEYQLAGASVILYHNDKMISANAGIISAEDGEYNVDTKFRIGCLVKVLTASQIMALVDDNLLDLSLPIAGYLPALNALNSSALSLVTAKQLLCHESGLVANFYYQDEKLTTVNLIDALSKKSDEELFISKPGEHCSYSNVGYVLLAYLIEQLRQKSWVDDLDERILRPSDIVFQESGQEGVNSKVPFGLCLNKSYQGPYLTFEPKDITPADGGALALSATELMQIAKLHLKQGISDTSKQVLSEQSVQNMQSNIANPSGPWASMKGLAYGWLAYADGSYGFSGDGIRQHVLIRILPTENIGLVIVANYHSAGILFNELWKYSLETIGCTPDIKQANQRMVNKAVELEEGFDLRFSDSSRQYRMYWMDGAGRVELTSNNPELFGDNKSVELLHVDHNHFVAPELGNFCNLWLLSEVNQNNDGNYLWNGVSLLRGS